MFENAGSDVNPILVSLSNIPDEIETLETQLSSQSDWSDQVKAMKRIMGLINGGALKNEIFVRSIGRFYDSISAAVTNLRSALVKTACLLIAQLARELKNQFESCGDYITPLSTQLTHGTQIIADSCKFSILIIAKNCPSRRIFSQFIDLANKRGAANKSCAAESFSILIATWPLTSIGSNYSTLFSTLKKLLSDAAPDARLYARKAVKELLNVNHSKTTDFINTLDPKIKRAIMDEQVPETPRMEAKKDFSATQRVSAVRKRSDSQAQKSDNKQFTTPQKVANPPITSSQRRAKAKTATSPTRKYQLEPMQAGKEKEFLTNVREHLFPSRRAVIKKNAEQVTTDLIICCDTPKICVGALALLHEMLPLFPQMFQTKLDQIIKIVIDQAENGTTRSSSNSHAILEQLMTVYPANTLLDNIETTPMTNVSLTFVLSLASHDSITFDSSLCEKLLLMAFNSYLINASKAARLVKMIYEMNPDEIESFSTLLTDEETIQFQKAIKPFCPEVNLRVSLELPRFDSNDQLKWVHKMSEFLALGDIVEAYSEINKALFKTNDLESILQIIFQTLQSNSFDLFEIILPGILYSLRSDFSKKIEQILALLTRNIPVDMLFASLQSLIIGDNLVVARNSIDYEASIIAGMKKDFLVPHLPQIVPTLIQAFSSTTAEIRKSVVLCFVELSLVAGNELDSYTQELTKAQRKLIMIYLQRRTQ